MKKQILFSALFLACFGLMFSCSKNSGLIDAASPVNITTQNSSTSSTSRVIGGSDCVPTRHTSLDSLPATITGYLQTNLPNERIDEVEIYDNNGVITYGIELKNDSSFVFDASGNLLASGTEKRLVTSALPQVILDAIATDYPGATIKYAKQELNHAGQEVINIELSNNMDLVFDLGGALLCAVIETNDDGSDNDNHGGSDNDNESVISIDSLPQTIFDYINTNYPTDTITKAEKDANGFEVYLSNGTELYFDAAGNLITTSIDDDGKDDDGDDGKGDDDDDGKSDNDDGKDGDDAKINPDSLSQVILDYITANYPNQTIKKAEQDANGFEVKLNNGTKLYFDAAGTFISAKVDNDKDGDDTKINPANLPQVILDYVTANYPNQTIRKAEQDANGFEVKLNNGTKLYFDAAGTFISAKVDNDNDDDKGGNDDDDD